MNLPAKKAVLDEMTSEQESITERLATEREAMAALEEAAENYHTWLLLSEERHEKLPMLDNVEAWLDKQMTVFESGDYGETLADVASLLSALETFRANLTPQKDVRATQARPLPPGTHTRTHTRRTAHDGARRACRDLRARPWRRWSRTRRRS